jgi:integrase
MLTQLGGQSDDYPLHVGLDQVVVEADAFTVVGVELKRSVASATRRARSTWATLALIAVVLREHLVKHRMRAGRAEGLVFGASAERPFTPSNVRRRALTAWRRARAARAKALCRPATNRMAGFEPITLHEARHTFASHMIAAGVNAKALSTYMGHASITITFDRYGHLIPGNEGEAAELLDAYLAGRVHSPRDRVRR